MPRPVEKIYRNGDLGYSSCNLPDTARIGHTRQQESVVALDSPDDHHEEDRELDDDIECT